MDIKYIDTTGTNYFIFEFNFNPKAYIKRFKLNIKRFLVSVKQSINRKIYNSESYRGKGTYVWRHGCWIPGNALDKSVFHSYFDRSMSKYVTSTQDIKEHEKEGKYLTTENEAIRLSAKYKARAKQEQREKTKKEIRQALEDIGRGRRSYAKEIESQIPNDMRLRAERERYARTFH
jgi:ABC-type transport system substrate-binding protein